MHREIASRMLERLGYIKLDPARVLDAGSATGGALAGLQQQYPKAQLVALDLARPMLRAAVPVAAPWHARLASSLLKKTAPPLGVQADMAVLPFRNAAFVKAGLETWEVLTVSVVLLEALICGGSDAHACMPCHGCHLRTPLRAPTDHR